MKNPPLSLTEKAILLVIGLIAFIALFLLLNEAAKGQTNVFVYSEVTTNIGSWGQVGGINGAPPDYYTESWFVSSNRYARVIVGDKTYTIQLSSTMVNGWEIDWKNESHRVNFQTNILYPTNFPNWK